MNINENHQYEGLPVEETAQNSSNTLVLSVTCEELEMIGRHIHDLRKRKGIKQKELSKGTGLSARTILDLEKGRICPKYETIIAVSEFLKISPNEFFPTRLFNEDGKHDPEMMELLIELLALDEEHIKSAKSFLKTYIAGAKLKILKK